VSFGGYANGAGVATIANSGFVLSGPNGIGGSFATYQAVPTTLNVYAALLDSNHSFVEQQQVAGGSTVNVAFAVAPSGLGTVSPSLVAFSGGTSGVPATFTASGVNSGGATISLTQPTGFTAPASGGSINVTVQPSNLIPPTVTLGQNLQAPVAVSLNGNAPAATTVTLTTSNASLLQFACVVANSQCSTGSGNPATANTITVLIPKNQTQSASFYAIGYGSTGSAGYSISAPGYPTVQATIPLAPAALLIQTPTGYGTDFAVPLNGGVAAQLNVLTVVYVGGNPVSESVAINKSVSVTVTSGQASIGTISASPLTIAGGSSSGTTTFQAAGLGTSTVTASAAGFTSATVHATVTSARLSIFNGATVGKSLESQNSLLLTSPAPSGGLRVTLSVAQNSVSLIQLAANPTDAGSGSIVVNVPAGASSASYYVYGLASSGAATYSASASGYVSTGTDTVTLAPSAIVIVGPSSVSLAGGPQPLTFYTAFLSTDGANTPQNPQSLAGPASLTVAVVNSTPAAGTVPSSVVISPGTNSSQIMFTPLSRTSTTISVTQPSGYVMPSLYASLTITVGP
jgi:hypothetical protein